MPGTGWKSRAGSEDASEKGSMARDASFKGRTQQGGAAGWDATSNGGYASDLSEEEPIEDVQEDYIQPHRLVQVPWYKICCNTKTAWLYPELPWGAPPSWQIPEMRGAKFMQVWEMLSFLACLYVSATVPWLVAFSDDAFPGVHSCIYLSDPMTGPLLAIAMIDVAVDLLFTVDIIINFHLAIWEISTNGSPHWQLIDDLPTIRSKYIRGGLWTDVLGQIPWQYLDCVLPVHSDGLRLLRLCRLLKLLRLYRLKKMIQSLYRKYPKSEFIITAAELVLTMGTVAHWMCCLWYWMGGEPEGWVISQSIKDIDGNTIEPTDGYGWAYNAWISAFYWSITTMSTIGYGDISATTSTERSLSVVVMVLGCCLFAWTTGRITNILTKTSICGARFNYKMEEMNEWMEARNLSLDLVERTKSFYMLKFPTMRIFSEMEVLEDLDAGLRKEVYIELYRDIVKLCPLFRACNEDTQREICFRLKPVFRAADTQLTQQGEDPDSMYIVRFGSVEIKHRGETLKIAKRGDLIGENAILGLTTDGRRNRSAHAISMVELCALSMHDFRDLLINCPGFSTVVEKMTRLFVDFLDVAVSAGIQLHIKDMTCVCWTELGNHLHHDRRQAALRQKRRSRGVRNAVGRKRANSLKDLLNGVNGSVVGASRLAKLQSLGQSVKNLGSVILNGVGGDMPGGHYNHVQKRGAPGRSPKLAGQQPSRPPPELKGGEYRPLRLALQIDLQSLHNFRGMPPNYAIDDARGAVVEVQFLDRYNNRIVSDESQVFEYKIISTAGPEEEHNDQLHNSIVMGRSLRVDLVHTVPPDQCPNLQISISIMPPAHDKYIARGSYRQDSVYKAAMVVSHEELHFIHGKEGQNKGESRFERILLEETTDAAAANVDVAAGSVSKMFLLEHSHEKPTPFEQLMHYTSDHENMTLNDLRVEWTAELPVKDLLRHRRTNGLNQPGQDTSFILTFKNAARISTDAIRKLNPDSHWLTLMQKLRSRIYEDEGYFHERRIKEVSALTSNVLTTIRGVFMSRHTRELFAKSRVTKDEQEMEDHTKLQDMATNLENLVTDVRSVKQKLQEKAVDFRETPRGDAESVVSSDFDLKDSIMNLQQQQELMRAEHMSQLKAMQELIEAKDRKMEAMIRSLLTVNGKPSGPGMGDYDAGEGAATNGTKDAVKQRPLSLNPAAVSRDSARASPQSAREGLMSARSPGSSTQLLGAGLIKKTPLPTSLLPTSLSARSPVPRTSIEGLQADAGEQRTPGQLAKGMRHSIGGTPSSQSLQTPTLAVNMTTQQSPVASAWSDLQSRLQNVGLGDTSKYLGDESQDGGGP